MERLAKVRKAPAQADRAMTAAPAEVVQRVVVAVLAVRAATVAHLVAIYRNRPRRSAGLGIRAISLGSPWHTVVAAAAAAVTKATVHQVAERMAAAAEVLMDLMGLPTEVMARMVVAVVAAAAAGVALAFMARAATAALA